MNLFDRIIKWLAPKQSKTYMYKGRQVSRVHYIQLTRQKANNRLARWWRWYNRKGR